MKLELGFDFLDGKHHPTVKITLEPCHADDNKAWNFRDKLGKDLYAIAEYYIKASKEIEE